MIASIIEKHAKERPDHLALIMGERSLTYRQLFEQASNFAHHLQAEGFCKQCIAFHLPNSLESVVIYLGCFLAGVVAVPLSIGLKAPELAYIFEKTTPKWSIDSETDLAPFFQSRSSTPLISPNSEDAAVIFFTSGSTGMPKGVTHSQKSMFATFENMVDALDVTQEDRFLVSAIIANSSGCSHIFLTLLAGGTIILLSHFDVSEFLASLSHRPTVFCLLGKANFDIVNDPRFTRDHFKGIKFNGTGGDKISEQLIKDFQEKTGIPMRVGYGMTECLLLTINKSHSESKMGSVGKEGREIEIRLVRSDGKVGDEGEVWVKGPNCMIGYWGDPEATRAVFVDGWLRTGDLARRDRDGFYWFIGRLKQIIVRSTRNISPFEVEEVLSYHPAVKAAGVIGIPHPEEGEVPIAFVELKAGQTTSEEDLIKFLESQLQDFKIPVSIKTVETLPRTLTGKIAREELRQLQ